jgi:predicted nucleic acid-binding protein
LNSDSKFERMFRQIKPHKGQKSLLPRERSELPFVANIGSIPKLLLDTTVYIDELQGKLPRDVELALRATTLWHSTVTECELSALAGLLDPEHPETARTLKQVFASIQQRPSHRVVNPDRQVWRNAGVVAGTLARMQQYRKAEQRRALNDALIFLSAAKAGLVVLTRNIGDFDLLMQLAPEGKAVFYEA